MKKRIYRVRRKMNHIISEINHTMLLAGCREIHLDLIREDSGLRLRAMGDFNPEYQHQMENVAALLQPAVRDPALVETYWELAGEDQYTSDSEMALVGQMLDSASVKLAEGQIQMDLFLRF